MNVKTNREIVEIAFALGGLGLSNFHGLGFLQGALERNIIPDMVSCTSGQIHAVWKYLTAHNRRKHGHDGMSLEDVAKTYMQGAEIQPALAFGELAEEFPELSTTWLKHLADVESWRYNPYVVVPWLMNMSQNMMPARIFAPNIKPGTLEQICDDFENEKNIGIAFNSYNPRQGCEYVYLNGRARKLLGKLQGGAVSDREPSEPSSFRKSAFHHTKYMAITPEGIMDALWLYEYGLRDRQFIDGSYFRMIMLSELSRARKIFVVRPIEYTWSGPMPITWGDREILKTEIFFNSSYYGERFRIELINRLITDEHALTKEYKEEKGYHEIQFYETEPRTPKVFAGYFYENMDMFYEARSDALNLFETALGKPKHAET